MSEKNKHSKHINYKNLHKYNKDRK